MIQKIKLFLKSRRGKAIPPKHGSFSNEIKINLKKYNETYRLLEEYDKKPIEDPADLADPGRLRDALARVQRSSSTR